METHWRQWIRLKNGQIVANHFAVELWNPDYRYVSLIICGWIILTHNTLWIIHFVRMATAHTRSCWLSCQSYIMLEEWDYIHVFNLDGIHVFNLSLPTKLCLMTCLKINQKCMVARVITVWIQWISVLMYCLLSFGQHIYLQIVNSLLDK